jgi:D-alanyl-D-alanine carboxypeptidase (penicillin-binding protein 5/6)
MNRFLSLFLCFVLFSVPAAADVTSDAVYANGFVTEYYSDDIYSQPIIEASSTVSVSAPDVKAKATVLMEKETGKVLHEFNSHEKLSPASITKIMTILLVVEAIDNGKIKLDDVVTTSEHAASMGGSQIWLEPGETMTVDEMLKAAVVGSANDASVALAEHIAGSEEGFVVKMNSRAAQLGMSDTSFKNACGLDEEGHYTSANDVAIMSRELIKHDLVKKYSTIWMDSLRGGETQLVNTNKLVRFYTGCTGLKTGTTDSAGYCLSATAKRNDMELIAVVMSAESGNERFSGGKRLLDYGFSNWTLKQPDFDMKRLRDIKVNHGVKDFVPIECEAITSQLVGMNDTENIDIKTKISKELSAPITKGQKVGTLKVMRGDEVLQECKVYTTEDIDRLSFGFSFKLLANKLFSL